MNNEEYICSVCGYTTNLPELFMAVHLKNKEQNCNDVFVKQVFPLIRRIFGTTDICVCYPCYLKALGVPTKEKPDDDRLTGITGAMLKNALELCEINDKIAKGKFEAEQRRLEAEIEMAKKQAEFQAKIAEMNVKAAEKSTLPPGYKVLSQETTVKEEFEWIGDEKGFTAPKGSTITVYFCGESQFGTNEGKFIVRGTRTYKQKEQ